MAGFPKAAAFWYRSNWGAMFDGSADRPGIPSFETARILDLGGAVVSGALHTISTGVAAELVVDGKIVGRQESGSAYPNEVLQLEWTLNSTNPHGCSFPTNLSDVQCHGLSHIDSAKSASACRAACCALESCPIWQYSDDKGCWAGDVPESTCTPAVGWVGGGRNQSVFFSNATLLALDKNGHTIASHSIQMPGKPTKLVLDIDAPNPQSGTGHAVIIDGEDVALVRATLTDANGVIVPGVDVNVTFTVSGPGRVIGVSNGDPASHAYPKGNMVPTYSGLARAVVQVTYDCTSPNRDLIVSIDDDNDKRITVEPDASKCPTAPIVVTASAPGYTSAIAQITTSIDPSDAPLAVARSVATSQDPGAWLATYQG